MSDGFVDLVEAVQSLHAERWGPATTGLANAICEKVDEEAGELRLAIQYGMDDSEVEWEIGDVLFVVLAACRIRDTDPVVALEKAYVRNRERWSPSEDDQPR